MALVAWEHCQIGNGMAGSDRFSIEVHFVPLSSTERAERKQRLCALLLRGALRVAQKDNTRNQEETLEGDEALSLGGAQK